MDDPLSYDQFRTGLTFTDIVAELEVEAARRFDQSGERMFITRHTILGRWCEHKRRLYRDYLHYISND